MNRKDVGVKIMELALEIVSLRKEKIKIDNRINELLENQRRIEDDYNNQVKCENKIKYAKEKVNEIKEAIIEISECTGITVGTLLKEISK